MRERRTFDSCVFKERQNSQPKLFVHLKYDKSSDQHLNWYKKSESNQNPNLSVENANDSFWLTWLRIVIVNMNVCVVGCTCMCIVLVCFELRRVDKNV